MQEKLNKERGILDTEGRNIDFCAQMKGRAADRQSQSRVTADGIRTRVVFSNALFPALLRFPILGDSSRWIAGKEEALRMMKT